MSSLRTVFRAVVMVSVLAIVARGWYMYGPSHEQVASVVVRAVEMGDSLLGEFREAPPVVDSRPAPAPFVVAPAVAGPSAQRLPPVASAPAATGGVILASAAVPSTPPPVQGVGADRRLEALLARLDELGGSQHELRPWGASGQLYRFSCSAAWGSAPGYSRHFEAVAAEPLAAVQRVVDEVAAWRAINAQR
jgi:hypothetical protein